VTRWPHRALILAAPLCAPQWACEPGKVGSSNDSRATAEAAPAKQAAAPALRPAELALRAHIDSIVRGQPNFEELAPEVAHVVRAQSQLFENVARLGALRSIEYRGPASKEGVERYDVTSAHGFSQWRIGLGPDGKINVLGVNIGEKLPEKPPTRAELALQMKQRLDQAVAADQFAGAVSLTKGGEVLFQAAHGLADRERGVANQLDTKFRIGSMNKMFTAVSVLQLAQAGKVSLDDTVGQHLVDYPNGDIASNVTVEQLLVHTGGTGDIFGPEYDAHRAELQALEDYVRLYGKRAPEFEPGSRFAYSNYGFVLLGLIIAKASGKSYYDYVHENVFVPAGMKDTGSPPESRNVAGRSRGYTHHLDGHLRLNDETLPPRATSAGGGLSTVADLQRFARALLEGRLLSPGSMDILLNGRVTPSGQRGPGFFRNQQQTPRSFGHAGGAPGMNGDLRVFPESGYVIAVLTNLDPPSATDISSFAALRVPTD
jgi:D-alanyl-D-alanine carboxypeptidase